MTQTVLMIGTRKGAWIATSEDRSTWSLQGPDKLRSEVHAVAVDKRADTPRLFMASKHWHWGPQVLHSDDLGQSWESGPDGAIRFPEDTGRTLEAIWAIAPSPADPNVVWAGTEPSALFRSEDGGITFEMVRSLWDHPHREQWGAGFGGQAIHTIVPHPTDPQQLTVAMSTGGVYRSADGGASRAPANRGIKAYFFPDPWPEFGQCVHKVAAHPAAPQRLFAQNHHGVYRSDDGGERWVPIAGRLPADFGFPIVVHPHRPETVYVFPLVADGARVPPNGQAR